MMIPTLVPYGAIADYLYKRRFERDGKLFIVDRGNNTYEVDEKTYNSLPKESEE